jgi:hypothetical protein
MYYRIDIENTREYIPGALDWVFRSLAGSEQYAEDCKRMEEILKIDPEILCSRQSRSSGCDTDT